MKQDLKFISTKLKMPLPRENYIKRILLMDRLKGIMNNKITIINGCAACGKTTLLTSFLREYSICKVKWISLDKDNNNIFSFWHYLLEAIKDFLGSERKEILNSFECVIHKEDIENILVIVINQLVKAEEFIIVLDDFHTINDKNTLDSVNLFVKYFPENIHLIILTRGDTGLYFGEIAMEGNLIEIDEEELRFTSIEEKRFLIETLNMDLKEDVIAKINNISEGWIGGVQLIALAINNGKDNVIKDINILNKYMIDYLSKEILESLSKEEKDFLICTAILSYFNKDIANELLDKTNCREIIESLVSNDLFLINIDGENYRYHTMLSEFLNLEFSKINKNRAKNLHLKASKIFKNIGDLDESINHLLEIEEYEKSLELIEVMGQNPKGWVYLTKIPLEIIKSNRELLIQRIFYDLCNMEMGKCRKMLNFIDDILKVTRKNRMKIQLIYGILLKVIILDKEFIVNKREILNLIREAIYYSFENKIAAPFIFEGERIDNLISLLLSERSKDLSVKEKEFISNSLKINSENKNQELLTNREVEVMVELSKGFSNKEIAEKLCISLATVKTHVINIYSKLQVSSRVAAVEKARNINIIK